ncbi:MAG TPA: AraC family transcriptional regulator [Armatimonadota bacterium]
MPFTHLTQLEHIFKYASPPNCYHRPRVILPGYEEIEVITAGHGAFVVDGQPVDAGPGAMLWFYTGDIVEVTSDPRDPYVTIVFVFRVDGLPAARTPRYTHWLDTAQCAQVCQLALECCQQQTSASDLFMGYHYARLLWEAQVYLRRRQMDTLPLPVMRAQAHIAQHYQEPLTIAALAQVSGVSPSHLHALYKQFLGATPLQLIIEARLRKARELLVSSALSVKEIGHQVGFSDVTYFCRLFKVRTQLSPTTYRQRNGFIPYQGQIVHD